MPDFNSYLQSVENLLGGATKGLFAKIDHMTFSMVINGLKGTDYDAVSIIIDQLVKEKRSVAIAPLYVVAQAHPVVPLRARAQAALRQLDPDGEVDKLAEGKSIQEAVKSLVEHFGNYKASP
ncbi:MAG TPA: hypothetical protein V6C69_14910 [Trichormus sp.]